MDPKLQRRVQRYGCDKAVEHYTKVMGFPEIHTFENSVDFLENVHALPDIPDVVFLDIQMRPYDGYELLQMLRDDPVYGDTTVIAMTANVMAHDVEQLREAGFSGLIGKPIMKEVFPQLVTKILDGDPVWFVP